VVSPARVSEGEAATALRGGRSLALAVLCVILFLTFLDNTVVSVALGDIQSELHADGLQTEPLRAGIARCLAQAPVETEPPPPQPAGHDPGS